MALDQSIFKAYDIRGTFPDQINTAVTKVIGRAVAGFLPTGKPVVVGRDMRNDSAELATALIKGLVAAGREVIDIGLVTTEMTAWAAGAMEVAGAAMITASHNPGQYNGIKLCGPGAQPIGINTGLKQIQQLVISNQFPAPQPGKVEAKSIDADWVKHCLSFADTSQWPVFKLAVDAGNGMAGKIWPQLEQQTQLRAQPLFFELDGNFPNHQPNPMEPANLQDLIKAVKTGGLNLGIAFDGDGDRAFFVDEQGVALTGSVTACLLIERMLQEHPGEAILYDTRMSRVVRETIEKLGGKAVRTPVGGGFIRPAMRQENGLLACEGAGHYYFRDNYFSDSGLITALLMLDILAQSGKPLSQLVAPYRKYAESGEISVGTGQPDKVLEMVANVTTDGEQDRLDGLTVIYPDTSRFNLRASHTEPLMRLNVEANTQAAMEQLRDKVLNLINH